MTLGGNMRTASAEGSAPVVVGQTRSRTQPAEQRNGRTGAPRDAQQQQHSFTARHTAVVPVTFQAF